MPGAEPLRTRLQAECEAASDCLCTHHTSRVMIDVMEPADGSSGINHMGTTLENAYVASGSLLKNAYADTTHTGPHGTPWDHAPYEETAYTPIPPLLTIPCPPLLTTP